MTRWIQSRTSKATDPWEEHLQKVGLLRTDRADVEWFNLDNGCSILLAGIGGWRQAEGREQGPSHFKLLHRSSNNHITDLTGFVLGTQAEFDRTQTGSDTYTDVQRKCIDIVSHLIEARDFTQIYNQIFR